MRADRRGRRRPAGDRQGLRLDPGRRDRPGRQPLGGRRAVRRAAAPERRAALPRGGLRDRGREHPDPDPDPDPAHQPLRHGASRSTRRRCRPPSTSSGTAFAGTGEDLQRIIDTGNAFIEDANANFDVTTAPDPRQQRGAPWPGGQGERDPHLRREPRAVQRHPRRLRRGPAAGHRRRVHGRQRAAHASSRTTRSTWPSWSTTWSPPARSWSSTSTASSRCWCSTRTSSRAASPWSSKSPDTGLYDAHFGLIEQSNPPICTRGYESTDRRPPQNGGNRPMNERGPLRRARRARATPAAPSTLRRARQRPVASYDPDDGRADAGEARHPDGLSNPGTLAPSDLRRGVVEVAVPPAPGEPAGVTSSTHDDRHALDHLPAGARGFLVLLLVLSLGATVWLPRPAGSRRSASRAAPASSRSSATP